MDLVDTFVPVGSASFKPGWPHAHHLWQPMAVLSSYGQAVLQRCLLAMLARQELYAELLDGNQLGDQKAACHDCRLVAVMDSYP